MMRLIPVKVLELRLSWENEGGCTEWSKSRFTVVHLKNNTIINKK